MGSKILTKKYLDIDVVEAAKDRIKYLLKVYDKVVVNFSGGKDSNAMLYVAIEAAREVDKLPIEVVYVDHEIEGLGTLKLIDEVYDMPEVDLKRYVLPFRLRNAASFYAPEWYPWHPAEKDFWVREIPDNAITEMENFVFKYNDQWRHPDGLPFMAMSVQNSMSFQDIADLHIDNYKRKGINAIALVGISAEESLAR